MYAALRFSSKNRANRMSIWEHFLCILVANVGLFTMSVLG